MRFLREMAWNCSDLLPRHSPRFIMGHRLDERTNVVSEMLAYKLAAWRAGVGATWSLGGVRRVCLFCCMKSCAESARMRPIFIILVCCTVAGAVMHAHAVQCSVVQPSSLRRPTVNWTRNALGNIAPMPRVCDNLLGQLRACKGHNITCCAIVLFCSSCYS